LRRPAFPPGALIVVNTLTHLVTFFVSLPILWALLLWHGRIVIWNPMTFLSLVFVQGVFIMGLSFFIATINVFYRDIAHLVSILLSLLFFLTPIFYRPIVESQYGALLALNPMVPLINSYRTVLFEGGTPEWESLLLIGGISVFVCGCGYLVFKRLLPDLVDAI
jgi:lipopolysaccharide transport system permease protein